MDGWIKLHRKMLDNKTLRYDTTSFKVFVFLLMIVDRKSGEWEGGRFQLAEYVVLNPNTLYKSLKRLEKAKMVTLRSNNRYSTISIVNWHKYQGNGNSCGNNEVTTDEQQSNTLTRSKELKKLINREERDGITQYLVEKGMNKDLVESELSKFISYWTELNHSGTKQRWELEKTFEVKKRLTTWFNNINKFGGQGGKSRLGRI